MMIFTLPTGHEFTIPDEWLEASGAKDFRATHDAYPASVLPGQEQYPLLLLPITEIAVPARQRLPWFDRDRMVDVMTGLSQLETLPAIEVDMPAADICSRPFRLRDGYHRLLASVAFGFTHISSTVFHYKELPWLQLL